MNPPNRIKELREAQGLSQSALARAARTTQQQIARLEKGERDLSDHWMRRLAPALRCHPADLMNGGPEPLTPRERAVVDLFRGLTEEQQEAFYKAAASLAEPGKSDGKPKLKRIA